MDVDFDSLRSLYLGNRVALPAPFPAVGGLQILATKVSIPAPPEEKHPQEVSLKLMLVRRRYEAGRVVRWAVPADQVVTFLPRNPRRPIDFDDGRWVFEEFVDDDALRDAAKRAGQEKSIDRGKSPRGIVFVPEAASILVRDEFGATGAEAAEYPWCERGPCCRPLYGKCCKGGGCCG